MFFIRTGKGINHNVNQQEAPPPALSVLLQCWLQLRWRLWNNKVSSCRECRRWIKKKKKTPGSEGTTSPTLLIQAGGGSIQWRHLRPEGAAVNETSNLSFAPSFSKPTQLEVEKTCLPLMALLASICYLQMRHVETPACSGETRGLGALPLHLQRQR